MPKGFGYPLNYVAWTPLPLRASYGPLEGDAISVIGRLAPGVTQQQADAELRVLGERAAAASPATHQHLRPRVLRLGEVPDAPDAALLAARNLAVLPVLAIACMSVGTLIYARTATRQEEIAVRSALGASRARIVGQLFVEALVLASVAAAAGLVGADRIVTFAIETLNQASGGLPFWATPGLRLSTILYAGGLAAVAAVMLSLLPALRATRARVQPHLANRSATLRFGHVWTGAMIVQLALTAIGIPVALETANEGRRNAAIRAAFPSGEYLAAGVDVSWTSDDETELAFEARRAGAFAALQQRIAQEPGVVAVTFADHVPGAGRARARTGQADVAVVLPSGARFRTSPVDAGFFEVLGRPIVAGRAFHEGDRRPEARTVIVNEAFARVFSREAGGGSPVGAHLRHAEPSAQPDASAAASSATRDAPVGAWFEIVGVVRDIGLDPDDLGNEQPFVFRAASADAVSPLVLTVRMRGNPATLAARLPVVAADVDARLLVNESRALADWLQDTHMQDAAAAQAAVAGLGLFLSAMSIFSLVSVNVSRRKREIGLRVALGAHPRQVLAGIVSRAVLLVASGTMAGGILLLVFVAKNWSTEDAALYAGYLAVTSAVMLAACLLACIGPARRALSINPSEALKDA